MTQLPDLPAPGGRLDPEIEFQPVRIALLTVSDTRTEANDTSGDLLAARIQDAGHELAERTILRDEVASLQAQVKAWIEDPNIDVVVSTGGTGLTGRDITPEAVTPLFEKRIEGFDTVWHMVSYQSVGLSTLQSRACAGVSGGTYLFALPGSPGACKDAWEGILKNQFDARHRPCNFVEIMPRLEEHVKRK